MCKNSTYNIFYANNVLRQICINQPFVQKKFSHGNFTREIFGPEIFFNYRKRSAKNEIKTQGFAWFH